jgi:type IV secretory pathway VirB10-like protein
MNRHNPARLLAAGALMAFAALAQAQYMWIDEKGLKQFSDRAPPPSIPLKNILKAPHGMPEQPSAAAPAPAAARPNAAPSLADREADYRKRAKEKEEQAQKEQAAEANKAAQADNCERARAAKRAIDSGVRIGTQDKNGERGYMTDEQRAAESQRANKVLAGCK